jgi:hypothetical protein
MKRAYALHRNDKVFQTALFFLLFGRLSVHHAVETSGVLEEVVDTGHNTEYTEREKVDTNNGDNANY